jgi:cytochrome P450
MNTPFMNTPFMNTPFAPCALYDYAPPPGVPAIDLDPFTTEFFADPYPAHALLRDSGPVVWLTRYGIAASARYEEVRRVLSDWHRVRKLELAGAPVRRFNNTLRGLKHLPLRVVKD